jgi:hypothetical protein
MKIQVRRDDFIKGSPASDWRRLQRILERLGISDQRPPRRAFSTTGAVEASPIAPGAVRGY